MEKIGRTKIVDLLKRTDIGAMVNVKGWVRTRRGSKQVNFIALNDGSTINNLQIVVDLANFDEEMLKLITTGACISVNGEMVESVGSGQKVEVQAREIEVLGTCDNTYPLQKKGHSMEFLREIAHLRPRTNTFGAVFRIRHNMAIAIHKFFHEKGFFYFHTPIITASDCEGAGQMFQVTTMNLYDLKKDERGSISYEDDFFGKQASLTVSGQLEGELAVSQTLEKYFIVRIAWVFGLNVKNFIKTMLNVGKTHNTVRVVNDQIGTPTYTYDLARLLVDMNETEKYGYYHATNEGGYISWYDLTKEIYRQVGYKTAEVRPVSTEEYVLSKATRPFNSRLDKSKLVEAGFTLLPTWQDALSRYLKEVEQ